MAPCGEILYDAFAGIAQQHNFPPDFPQREMAQGVTTMLFSALDRGGLYGVVAERDGTIVGSNFLTEGDEIRGVGPITVNPNVQGGGVGRRLMQDVIERGSAARGIRLVQDAFNMTSMSLYTSLGFDIKEPLVMVKGMFRRVSSTSRWLECCEARMRTA